MPLLNLGVTVIVIAIGLGLIRHYLRMTARVNMILNVIVAAIVCAWLVEASGLWGSVTKFHLPR